MYNTFYLINQIILNIQNIIIDAIVYNFEKTKENTLKKTSEINTALSNQIRKYELDVKAFEFIVFSANQINKVIYFLYCIYESNTNLKYAVDNSIYFFKYINCIITNQRIEPMNKNWICTTVILKKDSKFMDEDFSFNDFYEYIDSNDINDHFIESCDSISSIVNSTDNILECMMTMKKNKQYINRIFFKKKTNDYNLDLSSPLIPSKHQFISIRYKHPKMNDDLFIDIDKEYYYAYNELLSPIFIKRYLEYQPNIFEFDMNYELEIIDNDVNTFIINSKQYILLVENTYTIKNIE